MSCKCQAMATRMKASQILQLLDIADSKQSELAFKLETIRTGLTKLDEHSKMIELIKDAITVSDDSLHAMNLYAILSALRPVTADKRLGEIKFPEANTFSWVLEEPPDFNDNQQKFRFATDLQKWLKTGSGIFHISGRPGSGKSTLMKHLVTSNTTGNLLQQWAATNKKQLAVSRFFIWKLGSEEQKTMRGLQRSILYDLVKECANLAQWIFPKHWIPRRYASPLASQTLQTISDMEVEAAFDRLLNSEKIREGFQICLFIDGLDEFDEKGDESLWSFSSKLASWTTYGHVKLCVSSREETSILNALSSAQRNLLHTVTHSDIEQLVKSKLASNPNFQYLKQSDLHRDQCQEIQSRIIDRAEGVFLWVVLVLKSVEEELAAQTSPKALARIVEQVPLGLDDFFARILDSIPRHHARGAYFIFAMMLRIHGYCIGQERGYHMSTDFYMSTRPSLFGLSCIFDAFESHGPCEKSMQFEFPSSRFTDEIEYWKRSASAMLKLQSWCKGLVEGSICMEQYVMFTHRSVSDFLSGELQKIAQQWNLTDDWIAEGFLSTFLAKTRAQDAVEVFSSENAPNSSLSSMMNCLVRTIPNQSALSTPRLYRLLDQIDTEKKNFRTFSRDEVSRLDTIAMRVGKAYFTYGPLCPTFFISASSSVPWTNYVVSKLEDPEALKNSIYQLQMLAALVNGTFQRHDECVFPDVSPIVEALLKSGISPNTRYPQSFRGELTFDEWRDSLSSVQDSPVKDIKSPWRDVLSIFLSFLAFSDRGSVPNSIWNELLVWLRYGAEVPADVLVIMVHYWKSAVGFRYPGESTMIAMRYLQAHLSFRVANHIEYFQTFKSTTVSSMIR